MDVTVSWWAVAIVLGLAACGLLAVCWVASGWAEQVADWLRRDRVTPLLEDDRPEGVLCAGCAGDSHCDGVEGGCDCTCGWSEDWAELPPERTWEQMTSHQLPLEVGFMRPGAPQRDTMADKPGGYLTLEALREAALERRMPGWEAEQRQAYAALDMEYPSGLMARVREAAQ